MDQLQSLVANNLHRYRQAVGLSHAALSRRLRDEGHVISPRRLRDMEERGGTIYLRDLVAFGRIFLLRGSDFWTLLKLGNFSSWGAGCARPFSDRKGDLFPQRAGRAQLAPTGSLRLLQSPTEIKKGRAVPCTARPRFFPFTFSN